MPLVAGGGAGATALLPGLDPDVITSCCGSLFSADAKGVAAEVSALAPSTALLALAGSGAALFLAGGHFLWRRRGAAWLAAAAAIAFPAALVGLVSCIALYVYEHPHHHCPFCILKAGHGFIGYWLYVPLFAGSAYGLARRSPWPPGAGSRA